VASRWSLGKGWLTACARARARVVSLWLRASWESLNHEEARKVISLNGTTGSRSRCIPHEGADVHTPKCCAHRTRERQREDTGPSAAGTGRNRRTASGSPVMKYSNTISAIYIRGVPLHAQRVALVLRRAAKDIACIWINSTSRGPAATRTGCGFLSGCIGMGKLIIVPAATGITPVAGSFFTPGESVRVVSAFRICWRPSRRRDFRSRRAVCRSFLGFLSFTFPAPTCTSLCRVSGSGRSSCKRRVSVLALSWRISTGRRIMRVHFLLYINGHVIARIYTHDIHLPQTAGHTEAP